MRKTLIYILLILLLITSAFADEPVKKSKLLATVMSLAVPGLGQYYVSGDLESFKYPLLCEAAIWGSYLFFQNRFDTWNDNMIYYGSQYSGSSLNGRNDDYLQLVGNYDSHDEYNQNVRNDARFYYLRGENLDLDGYYNYLEENLIAGNDVWEWKSTEKRMKYRGIREKSRDYILYQQYSIGAVVANHLISAIFANRMTSKYNKSLNIAVIPTPDDLYLAVRLKF